MACEGSSYTRTAKRSLGVYDLIAAAEWRESTSRYSALEQSDRTHGRSHPSKPNTTPSRTNKGVCVRRRVDLLALVFNRMESTLSDMDRQPESGAQAGASESNPLQYFPK